MRQESNIKDQGRGAKPRPFLCRCDLGSPAVTGILCCTLCYIVHLHRSACMAYIPKQKSRTARKLSCLIFYISELVLLHADRNFFAVDVPILFVADCFAKNDIVCKNVMRNSLSVLVNNSRYLFAAAYGNSDVIHYLKA